MSLHLLGATVALLVAVVIAWRQWHEWRAEQRRWEHVQTYDRQHAQAVRRGR